ncbi:hypothetical protein E2C01_035991 [Portunus trituberculatus]|uniref:Uncharacterized protein n=1 Tax=Portunus trituberculatus TaxID=210409 RepID=A0A5B7F4M5_PORTR|nr:hypothetical protein [Portunus trituberculatus]
MLFWLTHSAVLHGKQDKGKKIKKTNGPFNCQFPCRSTESVERKG